MKSRKLWLAMFLAALVWWACIILSAVHFGMKATVLVVIGGLAVACAVKVDRKMDEAGDGD